MPKGYEVAANGFLRGIKKKGGKTTWSWRANEPMASYLATIDIGHWDVTERTQAGLPSYDAISSEITGGLRAEIENSMARQGEILDMLSAAFGPYPFKTVGGIVPEPGRSVLRAGDPDPAGLLEAVLARPTMAIR